MHELSACREVVGVCGHRGGALYAWRHLLLGMEQLGGSVYLLFVRVHHVSYDFALAICRLEQHTERASSFLIMSIVGGAIAPVLMGICGEEQIRYGFIIPLVCFGIIAVYALRYRLLLAKD